MVKPFSLSKYERLKSKKDIDTLFLNGKAFFVFPFKVIYSVSGSECPSRSHLFGISVPKKIFKRAVDRNLIKRRVRELYRLNKIELKETLIQHKKNLHVMLVYTDHKILSSEALLPAILQVLKKLIKQSGNLNTV